MLGSSEIDLRNSFLQPGNNHLNVACILGEVKLIVPSHWKVILELSPILGEVKDKRDTHLEQDEEKILIVTGYCALGEVKVKG